MIEYPAEGLPIYRCSTECDRAMVIDLDGETFECQHCGKREHAPSVIEALLEYGDTNGREQDHEDNGRGHPSRWAAQDSQQ